MPVKIAVIAVQAVDVDVAGAITLADVIPSTTVAVVKTGILDLTIDLPVHILGSPVFDSRVEHDHGTFKHCGAILVDRRGRNDLGNGH